jgi:hypothetical protein
VEELVEKLLEELVGRLPEELVDRQELVGRLSEELVGRLPEELVGRLPEELVGRLLEELVGRLPVTFQHDTKYICILRGATLIRILQSAVNPLAPKPTALGKIKMPSPKSF